MERLAAGHDAALNDLMERHGKPLFIYLLRILPTEAEAEDLAQEAFVRVHQHRAKFNPKLKFTTWLYAIATNLARDRLRWRSRRPEISLDAEPEDGTSLGDQLPFEAPSPAESSQLTERAQLVRAAIGRLSEDLRLPLILAEYEQLSQSEIGEVLGCSAKAVEMRIYRARLQLRQELKASLQA